MFSLKNLLDSLFLELLVLFFLLRLKKVEVHGSRKQQEDKDEASWEHVDGPAHSTDEQVVQLALLVQGLNGVSATNVVAGYKDLFQRSHPVRRWLRQMDFFWGEQGITLGTVLWPVRLCRYACISGPSSCWSNSMMLALPDPLMRLSMSSLARLQWGQ